MLLAALLARGVALSPPAADRDAEGRVVEALVWLSANTSVDGLIALDDALGPEADRLWLALANLVRRVDGGQAASAGRAGALIAAAALRQTSSPVVPRSASTELE